MESVENISIEALDYRWTMGKLKLSCVKVAHVFILVSCYISVDYKDFLLLSCLEPLLIIKFLFS